MQPKVKIQVRQIYPDREFFGVWGYVWRVPWFEEIGNFNPMFCRVERKRTLVESDAGDLSDPFRRDNSYIETLYVELKAIPSEWLLRQLKRSMKPVSRRS